MNNGFLKLGLIGHPLTHTLSPVLHAELLRMTGLKGEYLPYEITPAALKEHLSAFAHAGGRGLNVTIPHKVVIVPYLTGLSPEAELMGAVNTLVFTPEPPVDSNVLGAAGPDYTIHGYNTDVTGFVRSLPASVTEHLPESHIVLLGAGGSARAVVAGLLRLGTRRLTLVLRNPDKAAAFMALAEEMKAFYETETELSWLPMESLPVLRDVLGVINSTPVGMWPETDASPLSRGWLATLATDGPVTPFVYDLIYRPLETKLLRDAATLGYTTVNGLDMLIHQGIAAFETWIDGFGEDRMLPPDAPSLLREVLLKALC
jgi:shikimate dehydrogenase